MKAILFDGALKVSGSAPVPEREGEALVKVICAGICNTDLEIVKGYAAFRGILGHEFVGRIVQAVDPALVGRRVVGEINVGCGGCELCRSGDARHCAGRTVLGIKGRDGAFAEYLSLPARNLIEVPEELPDEAAVFVEPLAAAYQILDQVKIGPDDRVAVIGDGKLAQLIARVMAQADCDLTVIGKHEAKLDLLRIAGVRAVRIDAHATDADKLLPKAVREEKYAVVIDATGSASGLALSLRIVKPRGTVVLKSTHHDATPLESALVVVNEVTLVGSRCGRFDPAISLLSRGVVDVSTLVSERFSLDDGLLAFKEAAKPSTLKVILKAE